MKKTQPWYMLRRGELLAEEFLLNLGADFISPLKDKADFGVDFMVFFVNKIITVQIKTTEEAVKDHVMLNSLMLQQLQAINVPTLILIIDTKNNTFYFNWANAINLAECQRGSNISVPVRKATVEEINNLRKEIFSMPSLSVGMNLK